MKNRHSSLVALLALTVFAFTSGSATAKPVSAKEDESRIEVTFTEPEKFSDATDASMETDKGREYILGEIASFFKSRGARLLPEGQRLTLNFTEVDLAGEYEPWRTGSGRDVRIIKAIYPPRFDFTFKITNEAGELVREGKAELRDMSFLSRMVINRNDSLHYEKDLFIEWMRKELPAPKK